MAVSSCQRGICIWLALLAGLPGSACLGGGSPPVSQGADGLAGPGSCLAVTPSVLNFADVVVNATASETVTLSNLCSSTVRGIGASMGGLDGDWFALSSTPTALEPGSSVTVGVTYMPRASENRSFGTATFASSDGSSASLGLFGEPIETALSVAPGTVDFGYVSPPGSLASCIAVQNRADVPIQLEGIGAFTNPGGAFQLTQGPTSFPFTLGARSSTQTCFSFAPPEALQYTGQVTVLTSGPGGDVVVGLNGWGGGPRLSCSPATLDFGPQLLGTSLTLPVVCRNSGTEVPGTTLTVDVPRVSGGVFSAEFDRSVHPYPPGGLGPGEFAQLDVSYRPTGPGEDQGAVVIASNGGQVLIPLAGQGLEPDCQAVVSPPALDFGNLLAGSDSTSLSFVVQNVGRDSCLVQGLAVQNDPSASFTVTSSSIAPDPVTQKIVIPAPGAASGMPPSLPSPSALVVQVQFQPTGRGRFSGEIALPGGSMALAGSSQSTCLQIIPPVVDFQRIGDPSAGYCDFALRGFSIENTCSRAATVQSLSLQNGPGDLVPQFGFPVAPQVPVVLPPDAAVTWTMACGLTESGTHTGEVLVSDGTVESVARLICSCPGGG